MGELDGAAIRRELTGRRPLHAQHVDLAEPTDEALRVFRAMRAIQDEIGQAAASTYIVSRTRSADDLLRVLLLAREGGLVDLAREPALSRIDIVPLFETLEDLEHAPGVVRSLLEDAIWGRQLEARGQHQERSEEHTSELQSQSNLVCRLLLEKKKKNKNKRIYIT